jgi:hypothetical protein
MKKLLLTLVGAMFCMVLRAQTAAQEIRQNVLCTASNYMAYPGPIQQVLTPSPQGMKPFYISHYGRHGSRFHSRPSMYNEPYLTLARADSLGKLSDLGREVMLRLDIIRKDAENRWGELTPLGVQQQKDIARRMMERFPEVFEGHTDIDARSTGVGRCILSMEYALMEMLQHNPDLNVHHNATHRDMDYLNLQDKKLMALKFNKPAKEWYDRYVSQTAHHAHLMRELFADTLYANKHVNMVDLSVQLFLIAAIMQNTELGQHITLYDLFDYDESYRIWKIGNARWYIGWGAADVNGAVQPYAQRNLLRRLIEDADKVLSQPNTKVELRFGHETVLLPLICLLDINGYGFTTNDLEQLEPNGWINYRIFPMSCNLQLVFYRCSPKDRADDVLFKVLLNENEATLPLPTNQSPYYRWGDFRRYYLYKLDRYEKGGRS